MKKYNRWELAIAVVLAFVAGMGLQWLLFEKEIAFWDIEQRQAELRVRIDNLEAQDLQQLLDTLANYGQQVEHALVVLGYTVQGGEHGTKGTRQNRGRAESDGEGKARTKAKTK